MTDTTTEETFGQRVARYGRMRREQKALEAQAEQVKQDADEMEQALLEEWAREGIDSLRTSDGNTVYLERTLWANAADDTTRHHLIEGMRRAGLDHFVSETVNYNTLSAWVRDLDREGEAIPDELDGVMRVREVFKLKVRRS